jgi:hypothetical protein
MVTQWSLRWFTNVFLYKVGKSSQWPLCYHNRLYKCILTTLYRKTFVNHLSDHCVTITGYTNVYWLPYKHSGHWDYLQMFSYIRLSIYICISCYGNTVVTEMIYKSSSAQVISYKKTFVNHLSDHCVTITGNTNVYWQPYIRKHL